MYCAWINMIPLRALKIQIVNKQPAALTKRHPSVSAKVGTNFANKQRSLAD
jgi:hypothetical protein